MQIEKFWNAFLKEAKLDTSTKYFECFYFGLDEIVANELLNLVLTGKKRATASSLYAFQQDNSNIPKVGDFSIVTDWQGHPHCVIETTTVTILPFDEMTFEICKREGEDDTLESWQEGHRRFFKGEGAQLGYEFTESMPIVFEDFKVVYMKEIE